MRRREGQGQRGAERGREGEARKEVNQIKVENIDKKQGMSDNNSLYNLLNPEI